MSDDQFAMFEEAGLLEGGRPSEAAPKPTAAPLPPWEQPASTGATPSPPTPPPGRFVPPSPVVKAQPRENGLGAVGIGLGAVGVLLGLFFPYGLLLVVSLGLGAVLCGWLALRHSVNTGAPGTNRAIAAIVLGVLTFVAFGISMTLMGREAREATEGFRGVFSDFGTAMDDMQRSAEIEGLVLSGTGHATLTLEGVTFDVPLDGCGLDDPVPGYHLVGRGETNEGRMVRLYFASVFLGVQGEAISVEVGTQTYILEAEDLFEVDPVAGTLQAAGTFRVPMSKTEAAGSLEATCTA